MIMVIGGRSQGKSSFAREQFKSRIEKEGNFQKDQKIDQKKGQKKDLEGMFWADGETAAWEDFLSSDWCRHFHLLVRRILKGDKSLGLPGEFYSGNLPGDGCPDWKKLAEAIDNANPSRILVTDEIGYGIVPIDAFEREYREETGRICCLLAEKSEEVWRVCCGLGMRLK